MARSLPGTSGLGASGAALGLILSLLVAGCYGAYQVKADQPTGAGTLMPTVEDKDAGLVGIAGGFDLKAYPVIAIGLFYRYLKFFKHYTEEVFRGYAEPVAKA